MADFRAWERGDYDSDVGVAMGCGESMLWQIWTPYPVVIYDGYDLDCKIFDVSYVSDIYIIQIEDTKMIPVRGIEPRAAA